jgi:serine/threonine protein kinase
VEEAVLTGRILAGRYRLGERLGRGGWGSVYAAVQMDLGRPVAIKVLHTSVALAPDGLARFEREAKFDACMVGALRQVKWPASKAGGSPRVNFTARTRDNP